jgi:trigger factor
MPEFEPIDLAKLSLTRPVYEPTEAEVGEALDELAKQNRTYEDKTGKTVKAKDGDMVVIDFIGRIDGEAFEGGTAQDVELVLGSGQFIPGFEEQLVGAKPDTDVLVTVSFPENYQAENLKGKEAVFEVKVKDVKGPVDAPADDAFAERLGIENLEKLRELLKGNLEREYAGASRFKLKRALLDQLDTKHDFPLPPKMVEAEFNAIWQQVEQDKEAGELPPEDLKKSDKKLKEEYRKIAERRVRLGLVVAELVRSNNLQAKPEQLQAHIEEMSQSYEKPVEVQRWYLSDRSRMAEVEAIVVENNVTEFVLSKARVTDKDLPFDSLMTA